MSARFRARAPGPVSGQLCRATRQENRVRRRGVSCCLSAAGLRFLGILSRPGIPPLLRSAYRAISGADPSGFSMFRTRETRPGPGALYTPGTAVPAQPRVRPVTAACRLAAAGPCHPGTTTRPGVSLSRGISKGSLAFAPPGHSPHLWSQDGTGTLGLLLRASHPAEQDPAAHAGAGTSLQALARSYVTTISDLLRRTHSQRATSCRNALTRCPLEPGDRA
jgi:hypothetical protein